MSTPTFGHLPQSDALKEAGEGAASIAELLSRDPSGLGEQDLDRVIAIMREQREKWSVAEAQGRRPQAQRVPKVDPKSIGI